MANKSLNDKYEIPFLSEWKHKDGGIYTALKIEHSFGKSCKIPIVFYVKQLSLIERKEWAEKGISNGFVRTVEHFKRSFKKIEDIKNEK